MTALRAAVSVAGVHSVGVCYRRLGNSSDLTARCDVAGSENQSKIRVTSQK